MNEELKNEAKEEITNRVANYLSAYGLELDYKAEQWIEMQADDIASQAMYIKYYNEHGTVGDIVSDAITGEMENWISETYGN